MKWLQTLETDRRIELNYIVSLVVIGLAFSILFHFIKGFVFDLGYPHNTFLFKPVDRYHDFTNIYKATAGLAPFKAAVSVYPPFAYLVMLPFTLINRNIALVVMLSGFTLFVWQYVRRTVCGIDMDGHYLKTITLAFLTYPFLFVFDRANLETFVFVFLALFIHYYRKKEEWKSMFFLACAISMKIYPGAFLLLFLADKKYRNICYTLLLSSVMTLASMFVLQGGVAASFNGFINNLAGFRCIYFFTEAGLQHNLSLFGSLRIFYGYLAPQTMFPEQGYSMAMAVFFIIISAYVLFAAKELWRAVAAIVLYFLVAPQVSFDYKLIHVLIPLTLYLERADTTNGAVFFATAFALLCVPKDYVLVRGDISVAVFINPLIMMGVISVLIYQDCRRCVFPFLNIRSSS